MRYKIVGYAEEPPQPLNLSSQGRPIQARAPQLLLSAHLELDLVVHERVPLARKVLQCLVQSTAFGQVIGWVERLRTGDPFLFDVGSLKKCKHVRCFYGRDTHGKNLVYGRFRQRMRKDRDRDVFGHNAVGKTKNELQSRIGVSFDLSVDEGQQIFFTGRWIERPETFQLGSAIVGKISFL